jgi:hypothetical protein
MYELNNYDTTEAKEFQPYENPPSGGYVLKVVEVGNDPASSGRPMVTLKFDIAEGPFAGAFAKYPKPYRQIVDKESMPYFKAMIGYFSESNPPSKMSEVIYTNRDGQKGFDPMKLMGLRIGGNLGEQEYVNKQGELKTGMEVRFLGNAADVSKMRPLPLKKMDKAPNRPASTPTPGKPQGAYDNNSPLPF